MKSKEQSLSGAKQQISFNLSFRLLSALRQVSEDSQVTLNEAMRTALSEYFFWYAMPEPVIEVLAADAKKRGKATTRDYVVDLLMRRYTDLMVERRKDDK